MFSEKEKGMTIAEMMAVLFIIAIILTVVLVGYRQNQQKIVLDSAALKLAADIRKQQSIAGLDDTSPGCVHGEDYKYGYGIYLNTSKRGIYLVFSDCDGNNARTTTSPSDPTASTYFPVGVQIDSINVDGFSTNELYVVFNPPGPSVIINGSSSIKTAVIKIRLTNSPSIMKTITINNVGMIDTK
jgi:prepilin-type N-terminal cleavage/methylation domain-containing protein